MTTINASTKISVQQAPVGGTKKKAPTGSGGGASSLVSKSSSKSTATNNNATSSGGRRISVAPPLKPSPTIGKTIEKIKSLLVATQTVEPNLYDSSVNDNTNDNEVHNVINDIYRRTIGEHTTLQLNKPHSASTTRDRGIAAADLATITKTFGPSFVLIQHGILHDIQRTLFPDGIQSLLTRGGDTNTAFDIDNTNAVIDQTPSKTGGDSVDDNTSTQRPNNPTSTVASIKPSVSALSLSSLVDNMTITTGDGVDNNNTNNNKVDYSNMTLDSGTARGKLMTPPNAREGCLLLIRALVEIVGPVIEPYIVGAFLAATLDECSSSHSNIREAADDASAAIVSISNPYSFRPVIAPILLQSLRCTEWRTKSAALDRLAQCASGPATATTATLVSATKSNNLYKLQVYRSIPILIPAIQNQVWDTKAQVSKGAKTALLAICNTNLNADIKPTIPALVNAICKPAETNKAISELMGTTFVVPVDESVLTMLCPLLARALKEKLAIHKRAACIVVNNMSKLVEKPQAIAPFGSLLVPELHRVVKNVQFEEIRDEALKALASLTKALGDHYKNQQDGSSGQNQGGQQQQQNQGQNQKQAQTSPPPPVTSITTTTVPTKKTSAPASVQVPTTTTTTTTSETNLGDDMLRENEIIKAEQERIRIERENEARRLEEIQRQEDDERRRFKEAMDAQIELDKIAAQELAARKQVEEIAREKQRLSTRTSTGVCQGCGLKKCKKSCMFYK